TLGETMDFIKAELDLALQTNEERVKSRVWRVSKPAALAFAARFYLYLHDYDKALYYADEALKLHSTLVNYETFFEPTMRTFTSNGGTYTQPNGSTDFQFDEFFYSRVMYNHTSNAVPSARLLGLYDQA